LRCGQPRVRIQHRVSTVGDGEKEWDMTDLSPGSTPGPSDQPPEAHLDSWKEIATYLKRDVSTVQRWEKREGMPIHRHVHDQRGSVYALGSELDAWLQSRRLRLEEEEKECRSAAPVEAEGDHESRGNPGTRRWLVMGGVAVGRETAEHAPTSVSAGGELRNELEVDQQSPVTAKERHVIQTIPKRGYRLLEQVGKPRRVSVYAVVAFAALIVSLAAVYGFPWLAKMIPPEAFRRGRQISQRQLTSNPPERSLIWAAISPDGKYLVYLDPTGFYSRVVDTGEVHPIPLPGRFGNDSTFAWFPDGTKLLVAGTLISDEIDSLWAVSIFGGSPRKLRDGVGWASVSPDGTRIAFIDSSRRPQHELWVMGATGGEPHRIAAFVGSFLHQVWWSPDGNRVAYMRDYRDANGLPRQAIESCDREGNHPRVIFLNENPNSYQTDFHWLSDGRIIFAQDDESGDSGLWEVSVDRVAGTPLSKPRSIIHWPRAGFIGLSATNDGKQLLVLEGSPQNDVYFGEFDPKLMHLRTILQFTTDEREDIPAAWTRESKAILFASDRGGSYDVYRQDVGSGSPKAIIMGPDDESEPRFTPDGSWILYWAQSKFSSQSAPKRLMRIPASGGSSELVLSAGPTETFRCPSVLGASCILTQREGNQLLFFRLDPMGGKGTQFTKADYVVNGLPRWDLSPEGSRVALREGCCRVRILDLNSGGSPSKIANEVHVINDVAWSGDGQHLFLTTDSGQSGQIFYSDLHGHRYLLWESANRIFTTPVPSPDGRYLAFSAQFVYSRNAWLLENF